MTKCIALAAMVLCCNYPDEDIDEALALLETALGALDEVDDL